MDAQRQVAHSLFDTFIEGVTLGIIPDVKTAIWGLAGLLLVLFAFEVILTIINGVSPSERVVGWWEKTGDAAEYAKYKKARNRRADFRDRYDAEYIGKNDAEAGMAYLKAKRSERP